jgi:hypothetical protein
MLHFCPNSTHSIKIVKDSIGAAIQRQSPWPKMLRAVVGRGDTVEQRVAGRNVLSGSGPGSSENSRLRRLFPS